MGKTKTRQPAVNQLEAGVGQKIVRRCEPVCGQRSCEFEERIEHGQNCVCAPTPPAAFRHAKIGEQPDGFGGRAFGQQRHEFLKLLGAKTVEKKVGDDQIKFFSMAQSSPVRPFVGIESARSPVFPQINRCRVCLIIPSQCSTQVIWICGLKRSSSTRNFPVPSPTSKARAAICCARQKSCPAALHQSAGEKLFQPMIMCGEPVKVHAATEQDCITGRFHQRQAAMPPAAKNKTSHGSATPI